MADVQHIRILTWKVKNWNQWRIENPDVKTDLTGANLSRIDLSGYNFSRTDLRWADLSECNLSGADLRWADLSESVLKWADLSECNLSGANLSDADLSESNLSGAVLNGADLSKADLSESNLSGADLSESNLSEAILNGADLNEADLSDANLRDAHLVGAYINKVDLAGADLSGANLSEADLSEADLSRTLLIETNLTQANISNCRIFGISAWKLKVHNLNQSSLLITDWDESEITVDNIEVAQFVYLLLHNEKIRDVISTIGQKAVLILGRFALPERKAILEAMRNKLREKGYLPIVFDFEKSAERDFTETIQVLAGMCLFVIADITNPKSSPLELQATVPNYMIPFAPIIQGDEKPFAMFVDLQHKYQWMMKVRTYQDEADLIANFEKGIINPALKRHNKLLILKNKDLEILTMEDDDEDEDE